MTIRDDARQEAERRYPIRLPYNRDFEIRDREQKASEQADREPSDAEVTDEMARAALNAFYPDYATKAPNGWTFVNIWAMKAALLAAQEVRRADNS